MRVIIKKKTDQLNFEDFLGGVTRTVTIAGVKESKTESQYDVAIEGDGRVWRPPATVLKLLVQAWGDEAANWIGKRATLYGDPDVTMMGEVVGGIRVSHLSHISKPIKARLTVTKGKKQLFTVQPLTEAPAPAQPVLTDRITQAVSAFASLGVTVEQITAKLGGRTPDAWTDADLTGLLAIYQSIQAGESTVADEFGGVA